MFRLSSTVFTRDAIFRQLCVLRHLVYHFLVRQWLSRFWKAEQAQSLIEYTLILSFVALAAAALFLGSGNSISGIWTTSGSQLSAANSSLSGQSSDGDGH